MTWMNMVPLVNECNSTPEHMSTNTGGCMGGNIYVLDLFSGIGGFKFALAYAHAMIDLPPPRMCRRIEIFSIDVYDLANKLNSELDAQFIPCNLFSKCHVKAMDVLNLTQQWFASRPTFSIMALSPPCQPYSRKMRQDDDNNVQVVLCDKDNRRLAVQHITSLLQTIPPASLPRVIMLENIENFYYSSDCRHFIKTMQARGYNVVAMLISPKQIGFPNQRTRLYIVAKYKLGFPTYYNNSSTLLYREIPQCFYNDYGFVATKVPLCTFVDDENNSDDSPFCLDISVPFSLATLAYDIVDANDVDATTCCFTKNYGRFINGTGSVYYFGKSLANAKKDKATLLKGGHIRYFTPYEVAKLMGFKCKQEPHRGNAFCNVSHAEYSCAPFKRSRAKVHACNCPTLHLPDCVPNKRVYALLGNSLNPQVVATILVATGVIQQLYNIN